MNQYQRRIRAIKRAARKAGKPLRAYMRKVTKRSGPDGEAAARWLRLKGVS